MRRRRFCPPNCATGTAPSCAGSTVRWCCRVDRIRQRARLRTHRLKASDMASPVTIVTGASSGIGAATARLLARRGHAVALLARDERALQEVAGSLPDGTMSLVLPCDVTSPEQVAEAVG